MTSKDPRNKVKAKYDILGFNTVFFVPGYLLKLEGSMDLHARRMKWSFKRGGLNNPSIKATRVCFPTYSTSQRLPKCGPQNQGAGNSGVAPRNMGFNKPPRWFWCMLKFGNCCHRPYSLVMKICYQQPQIKNICWLKSKWNFKRELQSHIQGLLVSKQNRT